MFLYTCSSTNRPGLFQCVLVVCYLLFCGSALAETTSFMWKDNNAENEGERKLAIGDDVRSVTVNTESYSLSDDSISLPEVIVIKNVDGDENSISFLSDQNSAPEGAKFSKIDFAVINKEGEVLGIGYDGTDFYFQAFENLTLFRSQFYYERSVFYEIKRDSDQMKIGTDFDISGDTVATYNTVASSCDINNNIEFTRVPRSCQLKQEITNHEDHAFSLMIDGFSYQVYPDYVQGEMINCGVTDLSSNGNPYDFEFAYDTYAVVSNCDSKSISRDSAQYNVAVAGLYRVMSVRMSGLVLGDDIGEVSVDIARNNQSSWRKGLSSIEFGKSYDNNFNAGDLNFRPINFRLETSGNSIDQISINGDLIDSSGFDNITPSSFYRGTALDDSVLCFEAKNNGERQSVVGNVLQPRNEAMFYDDGYQNAFSDFCQILIDHEINNTGQRLFYFPKLGSAVSLDLSDSNNITGWLPSIVMSLGLSHDDYVMTRGSYHPVIPTKVSGHVLTSIDFIAGLINVYEK